jgi:hypothetical protein
LRSREEIEKRISVLRSENNPFDQGFSAETEGFEPTPIDLSELCRAVLPFVSADLDLSVVCTVGLDSM